MSLPDHGSGSSGGGPGDPPTGPAFGSGGAGPYLPDARMTPTGAVQSGVAPTAAMPAAVSPQWEEPLDDEDLVGPEPRRGIPWVTGLLALAVVAAGAFWGGVMTQKHHDRNLVGTTTAATGGATAGRSRGGGFGGFGATGGGGGAGATVGQVKLVDGDTIYVTDNSGNTVTVKTTDSSTFTKQTSVGLNAVAPGDTVIIRGAPQSDGSISAATVTDNGPGGTTTGASRFGGGGFGGGGGATGTGGTGGGGAAGGGGGD